MPVANTMATRRRVIEHYLAGQPKLQIAQAEKLNYGTVCTWCKRYEAAGWEGLKPQYDHCGPATHQSSELIYRAVRCLKSWHPKWGAGRIRAKLEAKYPQADLPTTRTLQRWFRQNAQNGPRTKLPREAKLWARQVHEVWQIDAKEEVRLSTGQRVCWLTIKDEKSSALIAAPVFPLRQDQ